MCGVCIRWVRGKGVLLPREQEVLSPKLGSLAVQWNQKARVPVQTRARTEKTAGGDTDPP